MLLPLFYLSLLVALTGAQSPPDAGGSGAPKYSSLPVSHDISSCPITYYGLKYTSLTARLDRPNGRIMLCFDLECNDFIELPDNTGGVTFQITQRDTELEGKLNESISDMDEQMTCSVQMTAAKGEGSVTVFLVQYETRAVLGIQNDLTSDGQYKINAYISNALEKYTTIGKGATNFRILTGCRMENGVYLMAGEDEYDLECGYYTCSVDSVLSVKGCPANKHCDIDGTCMPYRICTLTGPTVINVDGKVKSVEDRCTYTLMSDGVEFTEFEVLASYKDRRLADVSFLDSVTLKNNGVEVLLEQGGTVKVDDVVTSLSSPFSVNSGFDLRKTQAGVFAKLKLNDSVEVTLFFDGNTAQLQTTGGDYHPPGGLCGDDDKASSTNKTEGSSCHIMAKRSNDPTDNCEEMKERCDILTKEPFTSCNAAVTPDPYIAACKETMCYYPDEDGVMCQYLEAYARACSLAEIELGEWRSDKQCSTPQISCEDNPCSDHEFCGLVSGIPTCLCRSIFASKYRQSSNKLGDATICTGESASLTLVGCLLAEKGLDYSVFHLNNPECTGDMDEDSHMVTFSFDNDNCGTEVEKEEGKVSYKNTIQSTSSSSSNVITRHNEVNIDFSCVHVEPDVKTMSFTIKDSSVSQEVTSGTFSYKVTMNAYTDADHTQAVDSEVLLDQTIWVKLTSDGLDENLVVMEIDSCWATGQEESDSDVKYDLIKDGCANKADKTVQVEGNGEGTSSSFSFSMFEFTASSTDVYLHCQIHLCVKDDTDSDKCLPDCSEKDDKKRKRRSALSRSRYGRSAGRAVAPAFISMAWTK